MSILSQLNSPAMYAICGGIVAFVALICIVCFGLGEAGGIRVTVSALGLTPATVDLTAQ